MNLKSRIKKKILYPFLSVELEFHDQISFKSQKPNVYFSIALRRSGQHAVLNWLCSQFHDILHFNNCTSIQRRFNAVISPKAGRAILYKKGKIKFDTGKVGRAKMKEFLYDKSLSKNLLYSLENYDKKEKLLLKKISKQFNPFFIVIIRDPYNWFASYLKRSRVTYSHIDGSIKNLEKERDKYLDLISDTLKKDNFFGYPFVLINYNEWFKNYQYRKRICEVMGVPLVKDSAKNKVLGFGEGSSFDKQEFDEKASEMKTMQRWKEFRKDEEYLRVINIKRIKEIAQQVFNFHYPF